MKTILLLLLIISCGKSGNSRYTNPIEKEHKEVSVVDLVVSPSAFEGEKVKTNAIIRFYSEGALLQDKNSTSTVELEERFYDKYRSIINDGSGIRVFGVLKNDASPGYYFQINYYQTSGEIKQVSY